MRWRQPMENGRVRRVSSLSYTPSCAGVLFEEIWQLVTGWGHRTVGGSSDLITLLLYEQMTGGCDTRWALADG